MIAAHSEGVLHKFGKKHVGATFVCSRPQKGVIRA